MISFDQIRENLLILPNDLEVSDPYKYRKGILYLNYTIDPNLHISIHQDTWDGCGMIHLTDNISECSVYYTINLVSNIFSFNLDHSFIYNIIDAVPRCNNKRSSKIHCSDSELLKSFEIMMNLFLEFLNRIKWMELRQLALRSSRPDRLRRLRQKMQKSMPKHRSRHRSRSRSRSSQRRIK